jgi:hypothetical protein
VFLVAVYLRSPFRLREVKVFDEEVLLVLRTGRRYGLGPPVPMSSKHSVFSLAFPFSPDASLSPQMVFITSTYHKMIVFIDISHCLNI